MSVQFGRWNLDGKPIEVDYVEKVHSLVAVFGPDGASSYSKDNINICYHAFHTTKESHREIQPHVTASGIVVTWDGRLDNRNELMSELRDALTANPTDLDIVAAAHETWGTNCFGKLIGDWALSIWNPAHRSLLLAKDPIGIRHLYYSSDSNQITWSTILDPLIRLAGKTFVANEEYIAGWLSFFPAAHLTPYVGIHSVPPSSYVLLCPRKRTISRYWDFDPDKKIRYRTDADYEEHYRKAFGKAVQRCLRSDRPVLAELSGGMDSSSIVCMADLVIARGAAETPRLDTISWYRDSGDVDDDRPYFAKVEEKRGRTGPHINLACLKDDVSASPLASAFDDQRFAATPVSNVRSTELFRQYAAHMRTSGHRVVLSGQAGEEATGGNTPTSAPELQGLLRTVRIFALARQLDAWAKEVGKPKLHLLRDAMQGFFRPFSPVAAFRHMGPAPWFIPDFVRRNHVALRGYPARVNLLGPSPCFQEHMSNLNAIVRRALAYYAPRSEPLRDLRYPYLDRDFLEFMYAIPRDQLVRVGQSRSLMKRALVGIVPDEILNRTKALSRTRRAKDDGTQWVKRFATGQPFLCSSMGVVDADRLIETVEKARRGEPVLLGSLLRTIVLEAWLRHLTPHGVLLGSCKAMHTHRCGRQGNGRGLHPVRRGSDTFTPEKTAPMKFRGTVL
jgi:asparagine synthase (glutamine-hydrolysing)